MTSIFSNNIHRHHWRELKTACLLIACFGWLLVAAFLLPDNAFSQHGWLAPAPMPIFIGLIAVCGALLVFMMGWVRGRVSLPIVWISGWFLGVALLELAYLVSVFGQYESAITHDSQAANHIGLAARSLALIALSGVFIQPVVHRLTSGQQPCYQSILILIVLLVTGLLYGLLVVSTDWISRSASFADDLTVVSNIIQLALLGGYCLVGYGYWCRLKRPRDQNVSGLMAVALFMVMAEFCFIVQKDAMYSDGMLAHFYKMLAYSLLVMTLFFDSFRRPYDDLLRSTQRLQQTLNGLPDLIFELDDEGRYLAVHSGRADLLAEPADRMIGKTIQQVLPVAVADQCWQAMRNAQEHGSATGYCIQLQLAQGLCYFDLSVSCQVHRHNEPHYVIVARDITERTQQRQLLEREARLNDMLSHLSVHVQQCNERAFLAEAAQCLARLTTSPSAALALVGQHDSLFESIVWSDEKYPLAQQQLSLVQQSENSLWSYALQHTQEGLANGIHLPRLSAEKHDAMFAHRVIHYSVLEPKPRLIGLAINRLTQYEQSEQVPLSLFVDTVWSLIIRQRQQREISKLSAAVEQSPFPVVMTDLSGSIEYVNKAFMQLSGYDLSEVIGRNPRMFKSGQTSADTYQSMWERLQEGKTWQGELINRDKFGRIYTESALVYPLRNEQNKVIHYIAHKEDISQRKALEQQVQQLSEFDQLTGLPNRQLMNRRFQRAIELNPEAEHTVLWLDIDNFKHINDTMGHEFGDGLLQQLAERLRLQINEHDLLARQSGDSFMLILTACDQEQAPLRVAMLLQSVQQPFSLLLHEIILTASIGIALYPSDGKDLDSLHAAAEVAMYQVKQEGRNSFQFFSSDLQQYSARTLQLSNALKYAIARDELHLVYQPQYDLHQKRMIGAEVLLRWQHPELGFISPAEFIPLAEQTGQIIGLGDWVIKTAAKQLKQWQGRAIDIPLLAINLSAVQFNQPNLVSHISTIVAGQGIDAACIELELTEAVALSHPERAKQIMDDLHAAGFVLALDDFGTGYSSMSYLKRFALHKLKIDQSFVRELIEDTDDQAIVTAIIQMAHSLGMVTIAEGVETQMQRDFLQAHGCDQIQGYHYARPLTVELFERFIADAT